MNVRAVAGFGAQQRLVELLEVQGAFAVPSELRALAGDRGECSVPLGVLEDGGKKCTLRIDSLLLEGEPSAIKKAILVVKSSGRRELPPSNSVPSQELRDGLLEECSADLVTQPLEASVEHQACETYGVLQRKYLFKLKPVRIFQLN